MNELKAVRDAIAALQVVEKNLVRQHQPDPSKEVRNTLVDEQVDHNYRWKQKEGRDVWAAVIKYENPHTDELVHSPYPLEEVLTDENNNVGDLFAAVTDRVVDLVDMGHKLVSVNAQTYHIEGELDVEKVLNGGYEE